MSKPFIVKMPKLGESIVSATIIQWLKKEGEFIEADEPLLEVSTDKVNSEIPAPVSGKILKIIAQVDQEYDVDAPLCEIESNTAVEMGIEEPSKPKEEIKEQVREKSNSFLSPAVLRIAKEKNLPLSEVELIKGSGEGGRVTKQDIENYVKGPRQTIQQSQSLIYSGDVERVQMSKMRKAIAENMVKSFYQAPHASLISEVDVTEIFQWIKQNKEAFLKKYGYKITITTFIAEAISKAISEFPFINASLEKDTIVVKRFVNIGIAVSVDQAIVVPVVRSCNNKSIIQIAKDISDLAEKARNNQLKPDDVKEGSITMTNFGMGGTQIGIPIIRFPEVAIIGVGAICKKPKAMDESTIAVRDLVHLSLTFDHRVLDGMYGCGFLEALKKHLENPQLSLGL